MLASVVFGAQRQPNLTKVNHLVPIMITTTMVEGHVESTTNLAINRMLVGFIPNLNCGSRGIPLGKSLNWSSGILVLTTRFINRLHMVYTNPIMMIHMTRFVVRPSPIPIMVIGHKNPRNGNQGRDFQCHLQEL
jgi:hypothetical protein